MLIFGVHKRRRLNLEVSTETTVVELKKDIQQRLGITDDSLSRDNKVIVLSYAGAELADSWILSDVVIMPGITIKIQLKDNITPSLYIKCSHSQETIKVFEHTTITSMQLEQFRSLASMLSGLPVGVFRLTTKDNLELFDCHALRDYGVQVGDTVLLETWDGWNEFLNVAIMGFTPQVVAQVSGDEVVARFQMKVALFIASHFGHVDLARCALKQGIRSDEPTGYHPSRKWCQDNGHIDSLKCPVHEATQCGQVGVLRLFVTHDIACLKAKDGHGLEPLNIALRRKVKSCASFLLSKQWIKVPISKSCSLHVSTYSRLKNWCDRAKERAFLKYGPDRSTQKQRSFNSGPLISHGIFLDGFSRSPMTGKSKTELMIEEREKREKRMSEQRFRVSAVDNSGFMSDPEHYFKSMICGNGSRNRQRQRKISYRWQKSSSSNYSTGEAVAMGSTRGLQKLKPEAATSHSWKNKTHSALTEDYQSEDSDTSKAQSISHSLSMRKTSNSLKHPGLDDIIETPGSSVKRKSNPDSMKVNEQPNLKSEQFKASSSTNPTLSSATLSTSNYPSILQNYQFNTNKTSLKRISQARPSETSATNDDSSMSEEKRGSVNKRKGTSQKLLLSLSGLSGKSSVTLPDISHEQNRRPFYYYKGVREDELVNETLKVVTKYKGDSSRERALNTLSLASSFSDKPWLYRVRMALNLTSNSLKRNVTRLQEQNLSLTLS